MQLVTVRKKKTAKQDTNRLVYIWNTEQWQLTVNHYCSYKKKRGWIDWSKKDVEILEQTELSIQILHWTWSVGERHWTQLPLMSLVLLWTLSKSILISAAVALKLGKRTALSHAQTFRKSTKRCFDEKIFKILMLSRICN